MPPRIAVVACQVLETEIGEFCGAASHIVRRQLFPVGMHDQPMVLRQKLADAIAEAEADAEVQAVVLVYGLCGTALVDLAPRRVPLVVPRAHDCITLFLGSKERYAACMRTDPGLYWYTPGWNRERRVPGPDRDAKLRADYAAKFDPEEVEALLEMDHEALAQHSGAAYTDLQMSGDDEQKAYATASAASQGWSCRFCPGDPSLLRDLLAGRWDDARFLTIRPGERIAQSVDDAVIKAVPILPNAPASP